MAIVKEIHKTAKQYEQQGYKVIEIPIEFKGRFELDLQAALMNIAGESISNSTKFISYENLSKCYNKLKNPFTANIISTGLHDKLTIKEFFEPNLVEPNIYTRPIFIHVDTSLTGDRTGISAIAVMGYKNVNEYSLQTGQEETTKELAYHHIFSVGIQCPQGSEISFQKTRDFIYYLKFQLGWNISAISTDGFQSSDTRQQLITMGFEDTTLVSLDKKPDGYLAYKNAINERRISHLHIEELENELINLNRDNVTGKVDHDLDHSKDISDSLAGAVYNASLHEQNLNLGAGDMYEVIFDANENNTDDEKTDLLQKISASQPQMPQNTNPFMPSNKVGTNTMLPSELQKLIAQKEGFNDDDNGFFFL